jgi:hypothetical protein
MDRESEHQDSLPKKLDYIGLTTAQVKHRQQNYESKFGITSEDGFFLPLSTCDEELDGAREILLEQGKSVETKMVPYQEFEDTVGGFEIIVDGRRFSIARDGFSHNLSTGDKNVFIVIEVENVVVSVLQKEFWPTNFPFEMTPQIETALDYIENNSLVNWTKNLANFLQLGDKNVAEKGIWPKRVTIEQALERFGIDSIDELKLILSSIGLEVINTSNRLADIDNTDTEVDALLEAIKKSQKKPYTRRRWLRTAL